jgi:cell division protein FtsZ
MNNEVIPIDWDKNLNHIIKVIGVGGGGNNAVRNMYEKGIEGVDFIICNTDAQALYKSPVPTKIQLGAILTNGLGAGCNPDIGERAALESIDEIIKVLEKNTKMLFIATGLGGGTGTGAAPVIAKLSKEMGILTVAIVTIPFKDEGEEPYDRAIKGLLKLREHVDSLLIIKSEKLYEIYPELSIFEAFPKADDIVATAAKGIAEIITVEGYINVDFADVKMVMTDSEMAIMGHGRAKGENRVKEAVDQALHSPLLNDNDISGAKNILVNISSGLKRPLITSELRELMEIINIASANGANFKRGVTKNELLDADDSDAEITVTIIATGFSMANSFPDIVIDAGVISGPPEPPEPGTEPDDEPVVYVLSDDNDNDNNNSSYVLNKDDNDDDDNSGNKTSSSPIILMDESKIVKKVNTVAEKKEDSHPIWSPPVTKTAGSTVNTWGAMKDEDISIMEKVPAYERAKTKIEIGKPTTVQEVSVHTLDESGGFHSLNENNSYLDRDVD